MHGPWILSIECRAQDAALIAARFGKECRQVKPRTRPGVIKLSFDVAESCYDDVAALARLGLAFRACLDREGTLAGTLFAACGGFVAETPNYDGNIMVSIDRKTFKPDRRELALAREFCEIDRKVGTCLSNHRPHPASGPIRGNRSHRSHRRHRRLHRRSHPATSPCSITPTAAVAS